LKGLRITEAVCEKQKSLFAIWITLNNLTVIIVSTSEIEALKTKVLSLEAITYDGLHLVLVMQKAGPKHCVMSTFFISSSFFLATSPASNVYYSSPLAGLD
jgi:hypothetical protein